MSYDPEDIQIHLKDHGYYGGAIDGNIGPKTKAAIVAFKRDRCLRPRPFIGPVTWGLLVGKPIGPASWGL